MKKGRIKRELMEMFLRKEFLELKNKKAALKECFIDDMKWTSYYMLFILISVILIIFFGNL